MFFRRLKKFRGVLVLASAPTGINVELLVAMTCTPVGVVVVRTPWELPASLGSAFETSGHKKSAAPNGVSAF